MDEQTGPDEVEMRFGQTKLDAAYKNEKPGLLTQAGQFNQKGLVSVLKTILSRAATLTMTGAAAVVAGAHLALTVTAENARPKSNPLPQTAGRGTIAPGTPQADRDAVGAFATAHGVIYAYTQDDRHYCWSIALKQLRAILGNSLLDRENPIGYFAIERNRESQIVVHHIHNNGVRTGIDIPAARRAAMLAAFGLPTGAGEGEPEQ